MMYVMTFADITVVSYLRHIGNMLTNLKHVLNGYR